VTAVAVPAVPGSVGAQPGAAAASCGIYSRLPVPVPDFVAAQEAQAGLVDETNLANRDCHRNRDYPESWAIEGHSESRDAWVGLRAVPQPDAAAGHQVAALPQTTPARLPRDALAPAGVP